MTDKPTRRDLMKPVQLLGLALGAALFAGIVTLISMGFFQNRNPGQADRAIIVGLIVAGIVFIVTLVGVALLLLAVDPADVQKPIDGPVLLPENDPRRKKQSPDASSSDASSSGGPDAPR